jgi:hypothetical protein
LPEFATPLQISISPLGVDSRRHRPLRHLWGASSAGDDCALICCADLPAQLLPS